MTLFRHELRQGRAALALWTASAGALLAACVWLYPEMKGQMDALGQLFASLGGFTAAFGMDRLNVGTLPGFYAVECGTVLSLGGAFYAALTGVSALAKEEREHTAELLLTHPLSRARAAGEKLCAVLTQIAAMDILLLGIGLAAVALTGERIPWKELLLIHSACGLLHLEIGVLCFGLSAFLHRGAAGAGMGLAGTLYVLELLANMTERAAFLKYVTPFAWCEGADILAAGALDGGRIAAGMALALAAATAAFWWYGRKDIS